MTPQQFFGRTRPHKHLKKGALTLVRGNPAYGGGWEARLMHEGTESTGWGDKLTDAIHALHDRLLHIAPLHSRVSKNGAGVPYDYRGMPKRIPTATGRPFEKIIPSQKL